MEENSYRARFETKIEGVRLPGTNIEIVREPAGRGTFQHALFDFDGTVSLVREGWQAVMRRLMIEVLEECPRRPSPSELRTWVDETIFHTTGMQTIYQMIALADEVERLGGVRRDPTDYKRNFVGMLMRHVEGRREALRTGKTDPASFMVKGAREFLQALRERGVKLCLASGTDEDQVREEAEMLGVAPLFESRIYGAVDDYKSFSKALVIDRILAENQIDGRHLLGFGDGYVEIDNTKCAGGTGVGLATDETGRSGEVDPAKRVRLLGVGADIIVPDYRSGQALVAYLMEKPNA